MRQCGQVREVLGKDIKSMWSSIGSVFNALCDGKSVSKASKSLSAPPTGISIKGNVKLRGQRQNSALLPPINTNYATEMVNSSNDFLRSSYNSIKNTLVQDNMGHFGIERSTPKSRSSRSVMEVDEVKHKIPYPKHGFTRFEWLLILLARKSIQKTLKLIGVELLNNTNNTTQSEIHTNIEADDDSDEYDEDVVLLDSPRAPMSMHAPSANKNTSDEGDEPQIGISSEVDQQ